MTALAAPGRADLGTFAQAHLGEAVGDCVLFGVRRGHEDDAVHALRAALALGGRAGVHTGRVHAQGHDVTGDAIEVATRLAAEAPGDGVLLSHETYRRIRGRFEVKALAALPGLGHVYRLGPEKSPHLFIGTREVLGRETLMVGRDAELGVLDAALERCRQERRARVITVVGTAGLGKTRLLHEFLKHVEDSPEHTVLVRVRARAETARQPYQLLGAAVKISAGITEDLPVDRAREQLLAWARRRFGDEEGPERAHFVGELIGLPFAGSPWAEVLRGDPEQVRARAFAALAGDIQRVARQHAFVVELEDIHWADRLSLGFFEHLVRSSTGAAILVVAAARPELADRVPAWREIPGMETVVLEPLAPEASRSLARQLLSGVQGLPESLVEEVARKCAGTPYFAEEIVKSLADVGLIGEGTGGWHWQGGETWELELPPTVEGVLQARLDRLDAAERAVARIAAVIGREFWDGALRALLQVATTSLAGVPADPATALAGLEAREIVRRLPMSPFPGQQAWHFAHDLLRDAAAAGLPARLRGRLHVAAAEWILGRVGDRTREWLATVAGHFEAGGAPGPAARHFLEAAEVAARSYGNQEALRLYGRAVAVGGLDAAARARAELESARLRERVGEWSKARRDLVRAEADAETAGDRALLADCHAVHARLATLEGRFGQAVALARRALAEAGADPARKADALEALAGAEARQGDLEAALGHLDTAHAIHEQVGARRGVAQVCTLRARLRISQGRQAEARADSERALALFREAKDLSSEAGALHVLGILATQEGRLRDAIRLYEDGLDLRRAVGDRPRRAWSLHNLSEVHRLLGDRRRAWALHEEEIEISRSVGIRPGVAYGLWQRAMLTDEDGRLGEAESLMREALAIFREVGERQLVSAMLVQLADLARADGRFAEALQRADEAVAAWPDGQHDADVARAAVLVDLGRWEDAGALYERTRPEEPLETLQARRLGLAAARIGAGSIASARAVLDLVLAAPGEEPGPRLLARALRGAPDPGLLAEAAPMGSRLRGRLLAITSRATADEAVPALLDHVPPRMDAADLWDWQAALARGLRAQGRAARADELLVERAQAIRQVAATVPAESLPAFRERHGG